MRAAWGTFRGLMFDLDERKLQLFGIALCLAVLLAVWGIGMARYLTADVSDYPSTKAHHITPAQPPSR